VNVTVDSNHAGAGGSGGDADSDNPVLVAGGLGGTGGSAGGIAIAGGTGGVTRATIADNRVGQAGANGSPPPSGAPTPATGSAGNLLRTGGSVTLRDSIVSGGDGPRCAGTIEDGGGNLRFPFDAGCPGSTENPLLKALAANGGRTKTRALDADSPAIDRVACTGTDQRGVARPQGPRCDVGAYEFAPPSAKTKAATAIRRASARLHATVNPNARRTTVVFRYGRNLKLRKTTAPQTISPGTSPVAVVAQLTGLTPRATYYYRVVATNADGTARGDLELFETSGPPAR
jgi:hypothetical protein